MGANQEQINMSRYDMWCCDWNSSLLWFLFVVVVVVVYCFSFC